VVRRQRLRHPVDRPLDGQLAAHRARDNWGGGRTFCSTRPTGPPGSRVADLDRYRCDNLGRSIRSRPRGRPDAAILAARHGHARRGLIDHAGRDRTTRSAAGTAG
jgi:hypothetical protein